MKVRIKGNSLRYRLSMSDVAEFGRNGYIQEVIDFGKAHLTYALQTGPVLGLEAEFINNKIIVFMPYSWADEWVETHRVGFDQKGLLYLLIEKDFQCIDNITEDQRDNYPNPNLVC